MRGKSASVSTIAAACTVLLTATVMANARPGGRLHHPDPITQSASCKVPHMEVVTTDEEFDGTATEWTTLPHGALNFHSKRSGCVVVTIATLGTEEVDYALVQMLLDGATACGPANGIEYPSTLFAPGTALQTATMTYLCKDVPSGNHSLEAQYMTLSGGVLQLLNYSLTAAHN